MTALLAAALLLPAVRPNIVYIMADDLGYGELGCYGQEKIPTPNIDRLAAEGVKMTRFYTASPVCAPTRCSLMTGKHQGHAAIRGNKEKGGFGPNDPEGQMDLPKGETTIAEVLRRDGYRTGLVGKWGLGGPNPEGHPLNHGFDFFYGYICQRRAHNYYPVYLWNGFQPDLLPGNAGIDAHQKISAPLASEDDYYKQFGGQTYAPARIADNCLKFIRSSKDQPFFLYYAPTLPHAALQAPKAWVDKFPRDWDSKPYLGDQGYLPAARPHATYAAMIAYLDDTVGQILDELKRDALADNTLVIFTSDNGATFNGGVERQFFKSNGNLRDGKMSAYDGGIREPLVARWPGQINPGSTTARFAVAYDSFATICEAAGIAPPKTDGRSYLPLLKGEKLPTRPWIYFEYPEASVQQAVFLRERWKLVKPDLTKRPDKTELYDILADPSETKDLAPAHPELVREGLALLAREHVPNKDFPLGKVDKP